MDTFIHVYLWVSGRIPSVIYMRIIVGSPASVYSFNFTRYCQITYQIVFNSLQSYQLTYCSNSCQRLFYMKTYKIFWSYWVLFHCCLITCMLLIVSVVWVSCSTNVFFVHLVTFLVSVVIFFPYWFVKNINKEYIFIYFLYILSIWLLFSLI